MMDVTTLVQVLRGVPAELMEALDAQTLHALAAVSPEVLRALKDVPTELIEALSPELLAALPGVDPHCLEALKHMPAEAVENLTPELLHALHGLDSRSIEALRHVPPEAVENLSPELLLALPGVSPATLESLRHVPVEVVESLSPELLHALAGVRPEVLAALKDIPVEVVEALTPELVAALAALPVAPSTGSERGASGGRVMRFEQMGDATTAPPTWRDRDLDEAERDPVEVAVDHLGEVLKEARGGGNPVVGHFGVSDAGGGRWSWMTARFGSSVGRLMETPDWKVAQVLSVLGSETRLAILRTLLQGPKTAAELVTELGMGTTGQAYHHLRDLERAGYVEAREGRYHFAKDFRRVYLTALALAADSGAEAPDDAAGSALV